MLLPPCEGTQHKRPLRGEGACISKSTENMLLARVLGPQLCPVELPAKADLTSNTIPENRAKMPGHIHGWEAAVKTWVESLAVGKGSFQKSLGKGWVVPAGLPQRACS